MKKKKICSTTAKEKSSRTADDLTRLFEAAASGGSRHEAQREQAEKDGKPYYDNDLVVAKPDGAPIAASWVSSQFGRLLEDLELPHICFHGLRHIAAFIMTVLKNGLKEM